MTDIPPLLPVILLQAPAGHPIVPPGGGRSKTAKPSKERQDERLNSRFGQLARMLETEDATPVEEGLVAADPELVVVFEVIESTGDLSEAFEKVGLELLLDVEDAIDDEDLGDDFARLKPATATSEPVKRYLHAAMANTAAVGELTRLWDRWKSGARMPNGFAAFTQLFQRLHDVRAWSAVDRVRATGLEQSLKFALEEGLTELPVNIELFYKMSPQRRRSGETAVEQLVVEAQGRVLNKVERPEIGYHAIAAVLPPASLSSGDFDASAVALLRAPDVLFVRPAGQSVTVDLAPDLPEASVDEAAGVQGEPLVAALDGLPEANHPLLRGRVQVLDPDDLAAEPTYTVDRRKHGTMVASMLVWGDRGAVADPARREVVFRPVMKPDLATRDAQEAIPWDELPPDLTIRAVEQLVAEVPSVRVVNLSLGDTLAQFDTIPSSWARAIDWLSSTYDLLFVVSAGNHTTPLPIDPADLAGKTGEARDQVTSEAIAGLSPVRRLLPPAESLNALTVGAIHADSAGDAAYTSYRVDVWSEPGHPSPVTAHGRGIRRAIKPDVAVAGGRQLYNAAGGQLTIATASGSPPGVEVAAPPTRRAWVSGTTLAAAEVSRRAGLIMESLIERDDPLDADYLAVAAKALLAHGASLPTGSYGLDVDRLVGYGAIDRNLALGCEPNQATIVFTGSLGAKEATTLVMPLPQAVGGRTDVRRGSATLAWMSPINWNHRQYRRAKLTVEGPAEFGRGRSNVGGDHNHAKRGTLEHHAFTVNKAYAATEMTFTVKCADQAGGLTEPVRFALAVSLEVGVAAGIDVYELVRQELVTRVRV